MASWRIIPGPSPICARKLRDEESRQSGWFSKHLPLAEHLARQKLADLFLDTSPYNAHTTASDALWGGLPVLTCMGETFASRVGASLLRAINLPDLVTESQAEFEQLAVELAHDGNATRHSAGGCNKTG